jgi:hypothetical protein
MVSMKQKTQTFEFMKDNGELGWLVTYPDEQNHHFQNKADALIVVMHQFKDEAKFTLTLQNWIGDYKREYSIVKSPKIISALFNKRGKPHIYTNPKSAYSNILNDFLYDKSAPEFENFKAIITKEATNGR